MIPRVKLLCVFLAMALCASVAFAQVSDATHAELQKLLSEWEALPDSSPVSAGIAILKKIGDTGEKLTTEALALQENTGESILRDDYFLDKSSKAYAEKLTIRDDQRKLVTAAIVADGMLTVAKKDHDKQIDYLNDWIAEEQIILDRLNRLYLQTPGQTKVWSEFLKEWRGEVVRLNSDRFRDALVQAAYSILRVAKGVEEQHIKNARERIAKGGGGTGSRTTTTGASAADRYPHIYRRHARIMLRIHRHYSRW